LVPFRLAYNGQDGLPRVIPIGFFWNGDEIVICTAATSPKVEALSKRPDVALTIDVGDTPDPARALLVRGSASVEIVDGVPYEYIAGSSKGLGEEGVAEFEQQVRTMYDQMVRISIEPRWARCYDFGAGRLPKFLSKLANNASK
jgi:Pyridoxamine 5'-phosphate oxidase